MRLKHFAFGLALAAHTLATDADKTHTVPTLFNCLARTDQGFKRLWLRVVLAALTLLGSNCFAAEYEVEGIITHRTFIQDVLQDVISRRFKVSVNDCKWLIRATELNKDNYVEIGFEDGTSYNLASFYFKTNGVINNILAAVIDPVEVPEGDASGISYLWLAYASSCYLEQAKSNYIAPVWDQEDRTLRFDDFKMKALWTQLDRIRVTNPVWARVRGMG